jgi:toxoflavin synthase
VDTSSEMLRVAQAAEDNEPLGIKYFQHDVATMPVLREFDGTTGSYLLHYATTEDRLRGMCRSIAGNLSDRASFVTGAILPVTGGAAI